MKLTSIALTALLPVLLACGTETGSVADSATDSETVPDTVSSQASPPNIPAADGPVRTAYLATVLDAGSPQLCLGPVAESVPPQCDGVELKGWRWRDHPVHDTEGDVRWGKFAVSGTWDGQVMTVTGAIPAALYDVPADASPVRPAPEGEELDETELAGIGEEASVLPGFLTATAEQGQVVVQVVHDDGSLQEWADGQWGKDVVAVESLLASQSAS